MNNLIFLWGLVVIVIEEAIRHAGKKSTRHKADKYFVIVFLSSVYIIVFTFDHVQTTADKVLYSLCIIYLGIYSVLFVCKVCYALQLSVRAHKYMLSSDDVACIMRARKGIFPERLIKERFDRMDFTEGNLQQWDDMVHQLVQEVVDAGKRKKEKYGYKAMISKV